MKNRITLFLFFFSFSFLQAQTFDYEIWVEDSHQAQQPDEIVQFVRLTNKTEMDRTIRWKLLDASIPDDWEYECIQYLTNFTGGTNFFDCTTDVPQEGILTTTRNANITIQLTIFQYPPNLTQSVVLHQVLIWDAADSLNSHAIIDLKSTVVSQIEPAIGIDTSIIVFGSEQTVASFPQTANHFLPISNNSNFPLVFKWNKITEKIPNHWTYTPSIKIDNKPVEDLDSGEIEFSSNETKGFSYILENIIPTKFQSDTAIAEFIVYNPQDSTNFNKTIRVTTILKLPSEPGVSFSIDGPANSNMVLQKNRNNINRVQRHQRLLIKKNFPLPLTLKWEKTKDTQPTIWSNFRWLSFSDNLEYENDIPSEGTLTITDNFTQIEYNIPYNRNEFLEEPGSAQLELLFYDPRDSLGNHFTFSFTTSVCPFLEGELINTVGQEICADELITIDAVEGLTNYQWNFGDSSVMTAVPTINSFPHSTIILNATHPLGCSFSDTLNYSIQEVQKEEICLVTVDQTTGFNLLTWSEEANSGNVKAYNIYREMNQADLYEQIGTVSIKESNVFLDSMANPMESSHRYRISVVDSCNFESSQSDFHKTLHLQINQGVNGEVNLFWDKYEGFPYNTFYIYRGSSLSDLFLIAERPANTFTFTDLTPPSGQLFYQVEVRRMDGCEISEARNSTFSASRSNPASKGLISSIETSPIRQIAKLSPNPATDNLYLSFNNFEEKVFTLEIYNFLGQVVKRLPIESRQEATTIPVNDLNTGTYIVVLRGINTYSDKIVIRQ